MGTRPDLHDKPDVKAFRSYYYLKEELAAFCRENHLPASGAKADLTERVARFLDTGEAEKAPPAPKAAVREEQITEAAVIEPHVVCSQKHRAFFEEKIGKSFSFSVPFQRWLKENAGKTYG